MNEKKILQWSVFSALGAGAYVALVALFMTHAQALLGSDDGIWAPIVALLLFVVSAAITSSLVLGKPILLYLDGKKKEAVELFGFTVGWLVVLFFTVLLVVAFLV